LKTEQSLGDFIRWKIVFGRENADEFTYEIGTLVYMKETTMVVVGFIIIFLQLFF